MKILMLSILLISFFISLVLAISITILKTITLTKRVWLRNILKKRAISLLQSKMKQVKDIPFPVFIELHFNRKLYENYYVKEGFFETVDYLFERTLNNMDEMEGDSDIKIYKLNLETEDE